MSISDEQNFTEAPSFTAKPDSTSPLKQTQQTQQAHNPAANPPMSLVEMQRQRNARRLGLEKPHAASDKLHSLGKTRTEVRQTLEEQKRAEQEEREAAQVFKTEMNARSRQIMEGRSDGDFLHRTANWHGRKNERRAERAEAIQAEAEQTELNATAQLSFVNPKVFAVSKVKLLLEQGRSLNETHSFARGAYQTQNSHLRNVSPNSNQKKLEFTGRLNKSQDARPLAAPKKEALLNFLQLAQGQQVEERLAFEADKQKRIERPAKQGVPVMPLRDFKQALHAHLQA